MEKKFPRLYARASNNKVKWWQVAARTGPLGPRKNWGQICVWYGYVGQEDDKIQFTSRWISQGKNLGKANATTAFEQACLEAEAMWKKKQDKKYVVDPSGKSDILLPMLAHDYKKRNHNIEWPALVQPKLNGVRCLAHKKSETEVVYTSREGKRFETLEHLTPHLLKNLEAGDILDGEIFNPEMTFQEIISAVKRVKTESPDRARLQYWVYDVVLPKVPFAERYKIYSKKAKLSHGTPLVVPVYAEEALSERKMFELHGKHVRAGLEGTIVRNRAGIYRQDFRSADLQKYKDFIDEEFVIIGGKDGDGKFVGSITWVCVTESGEEFDVVPKGTMDQRRQWYKEREQHFGKKITVRYQNLSDDRRVPIFPVGLAIRDYE